MSTDLFYKKILSKCKYINLILEASYEGNVGIIEVMNFYELTAVSENDTPLIVKTKNEFRFRFEHDMENQNIKDAWEIIYKVVGYKLHGSENI